MGSRAGLDGRKISSPRGFDPGTTSPSSVAIPTELADPFEVWTSVSFLKPSVIVSIIASVPAKTHFSFFCSDIYILTLWGA